MTITVDSKGNVPLPTEILRASDVHAGDQLDVLADDGTIILRKVSQPTTETLLDILRGLKGLPIADRNESKPRSFKDALASIPNVGSDDQFAH